MDNSVAGHELEDIEGLLTAVDVDGARLKKAIDDVRSAPAEAVRDVVSAIRRRKQAAPQTFAAFAELLNAAQERLVDLEAEQSTEDARRSTIGADEPSRRRVLAELRVRAQHPAALAAGLSLAPETISRVLKHLKKEGHVAFDVDPDDRRRRVYVLTERGLLDLEDREDAMGLVAEPRPNAAARRRFLARAVRQAVADRRIANRLAECISRLRIVMQQAQDERFFDIELFARRELITTLRQSGDAGGAEREIAVLKRFGEGEAPEASLVLPANCHYQYEVGRLARASLPKRATFLEAAIVGYTQLADRSTASDSICDDDWRLRAAWSSASLADNLREQTQLGRAVEQAALAKRQFEALGDEYGRARCEFLLGFCLRLRGQFAESEVHLRQALKIAEQENYLRWRADCLTQIGDVQRCQGDPASALASLEEALGIADSLSMRVTSGFAESAAGVALFHLGQPEAAAARLRSAQSLFEKANHREGRALNLRRLAVVERQLGTISESIDHSIEALRHYDRMSSPAGVTACLIGLGWSFQVRKSDAELDLVCRTLLARILRRPSRRLLLEKDPWVPQSLHQFATAVNAQPLAQDAELVLAAAQSRLDEVLSPPSPLTLDTGDDPNPLFAALEHDAVLDVNSHDAAAKTYLRLDEMAGEPRRDAERDAA